MNKFERLKTSGALLFSLVVSVSAQEIAEPSAAGSIAYRANHERAGSSVNRAVVAVLPWKAQDETLFAAQERHWLETFPGLVRSRLRLMPVLKVVPVDITERESVLLKPNESKPFHIAEDVRWLGERLKADWVLQGVLAHKETMWVLRMQVLRTGAQGLGEVFEVSATDGLELIDQTMEHLFHHLRIEITVDDAARQRRCWTRSSSALESFSLAMNGGEQDPERIAMLCQEALAKDDRFIEARAFLAAMFYKLGRDEECLEEVRQALLLKSEDGYATGRLRFLLATLLAGKKLVREAGDEVTKGLEMSPDDADLWHLQASLREYGRDIEGALVSMRKAVECDPRNPFYLARLAEFQWMQSDRAGAWQSLERAESLMREVPGMGDVDLELTLASAYHKFGDVPQALRHYRRFLTLAEGVKRLESRLPAIRKEVDELERRSRPWPVKVVPPKVYSPVELAATLRERLSGEELALVVNPIEFTPEMKEWALRVAAGVEGDLARARKVFDDLVSRRQLVGGEARAARDVFQAWNDPSQSFSCQELTKLFVALARSLDIASFYVHVERDDRNAVVDHDCAAVFDEGNGQAWLVDPTYGRWGIPHREFRVLNDLQAVAHHSFQPHEGKADVESCRVGLKLDPDFAWGRMRLVGALIQASLYDQARRELDAVWQMAPDYWRAYQWEGVLAMQQNRFQEADEWLRRAREACPESGDIRIQRADVLLRNGQPAAAREEVLAGLQRAHRPEFEPWARKTLALLDEALHSTDPARSAFLTNVTAGDYFNLGLSFLTGLNPEPAEAMKWFTKAAELGDSEARNVLGLLYWSGHGVPKDTAQAVRWFREAAEAGVSQAMRNLSNAYDMGLGVPKDVGESKRWLHRAAEAGDAAAQMILGKSYYIGAGVSKSVTEAMYWLRLAAEPRESPPALWIGDRELLPVERESRALLEEIHLFATEEEIAAVKTRVESQMEKPVLGSRTGEIRAPSTLSPAPVE